MDIAQNQTWTKLDTPSLSVSQAAEMLNVSDKTLRRWDSAGLLKPQRSPTGRRIYTREMIEEFIKVGRHPQPKSDTPKASNQFALAERTAELLKELRELLPQATLYEECAEVVSKLGEYRHEVMNADIRFSKTAEDAPLRIPDGMDVMTFACDCLDRANAMLDEFGNADDRQELRRRIDKRINR